MGISEMTTTAAAYRTPPVSPCAASQLREAFLPCVLHDPDFGLADNVKYIRRRVRRAQSLVRSGSAFDSLYEVISGFFKSSVLLEDGRNQVTGFHMAGEILGLHGIGTDRHAIDVTALEDSEVCVIPCECLEQPGLQRQLRRMMSRELVRDQGVMTLLGSMRAEERLAAFLLNLSQRFVARGYSPTEFHLRMTREEIGSYLGLSLETVSRLFSRFQDDGYIQVRKRHIVIHHVAGLRGLLSRDAD